MRVAVVGAAGFVGRRVAQLVAERGDDVIAFARSGAFEHERVVWRLGDAFDARPADLRGVDVVVHAAGARNAAKAQRDVALAEWLVQVCGQAGTPWLILLSTYAVWGDREIPALIGENRNPLDAYAAIKVAVEDVVLQCSSWPETKRTVVRLPGVYGPGGQGIADIAKQRLAAGETLSLSWNFTNQLVHADDAADALHYLLRSGSRPVEVNIEGETMTAASLERLVQGLGGVVEFTQTRGRRYQQRGTIARREWSVARYLAS